MVEPMWRLKTGRHHRDLEPIRQVGYRGILRYDPRMGRRLSPERRAAAIARWRPRLRPFLEGARLTKAALATALDLDPAAPEWTRRSPVAEAIRDLRRAVADPENAGRSVDNWIGTYLVDRGEHLLIAEEQRKAVLAAIRDVDRRARSDRMRLLRVPEPTARRLQTFAEGRRVTPAEAILILLKECATGRRNKSHVARSREMAVADLLEGLNPSTPHVDGGGKPTGGSTMR